MGKHKQQRKEHPRLYVSLQSWTHQKVKIDYFFFILPFDFYQLLLTSFLP